MGYEPEENEQNVYGDQARESLMEDGEISPEEDAFMSGYDASEDEDEETHDDLYEQAFATRKTRRRRTKAEDLDLEEF